MWTIKYTMVKFYGNGKKIEKEVDKENAELLLRVSEKDDYIYDKLGEKLFKNMGL